MESCKLFSKALLLVWLLILLSSAVSKQQSGTKVYKVVNSAAVPNLCGNSVECENANYKHSNVKTKGICPPLPPTINATDDDSIPLQNRLSTGVTAMMNAKVAVGAHDKATFFMGISGSGISTVVQLLAGNLSSIFVTKSDGKFVIFDAGDKISLRTTKSKTLLPEFVVSKETGQVFVDCPEFNDDRDTETDVEAMYFLKAALDSVREAKFIFTVKFPTIDTDDKTTFDLLVRHAVTLIPNTTISSALALIVTETPRLNKNDTLHTREQIFTMIQTFLERYESDLRGDLDTAKTDLEKEFVQRKIDLVVILTSNLGKDHFPTKISYLRTPEDCGALDELPEMLDSKKMLTDLYNNSIYFAAVNPNDFTITLKDATVHDILTQIIPSTTGQIATQTKIGIETMEQNFWRKFYSNLETTTGQGPSKALKAAVDKINFYLSRSENYTNFAHLLFDLFTDLQMNENEKLCITNKIQELDKQFSFFKNFSSFPIQYPPFSWVAPLKMAQEEFSDFLLFYNFCDGLKKHMGAYEMQVLLDQLQRKKEAQFNSTNVLDFLAKNEIASVLPEILDIFHLKLREKDKDYLVAVVTAEMPNVNLTCEPSSLNGTLHRLKVFGKRVKISDIINIPISWLSPRQWPEQCANVSNVQQLTIFASDKVFFDIDLDLNCKGIHVAILAPEWEVVGASKIMPGCDKAPSFPGDAPILQPGAPGVSGIDGGTFVGLLTTVKNPNNLEIVTDGGPGGTGQNGGRGPEGLVGLDAKKSAFPGRCPYVQAPCGAAKVGQVISADGRTRIDGDAGHMWLYMSGTPGEKGGQGMPGGNGGCQGKGGSTKLVVPKETQTIFNVSQQPGPPGKGGKGGEGGLGGLSGSYLSCGYNRFSGGTQVWFDMSPASCELTVSNTKGIVGDKGKDGNDSLCINPNATVPLGFMPWRLINEYKLIFGNGPKRLEFTKNLDTRPEFLELGTPLSFAHELLELEIKYYQESRSLRDDYGKWDQSNQQYVQFYEDYLSKIKSYAKLSSTNSSKIVLTTAEKIALNYLYVTVLSKAVALRENLMNAPKVINTQEYFQAVEEQLVELQREESSKAISEAISKETAKYEGSLNAKILEAHDFIQKSVLPSIDTTQDILNELDKKLVIEIDEWLKRAEQYEQNLEEMKRKMEEAMSHRGLFGILKIVGMAAQFFGPIGNVVGTAIGAISDIASDLSLDTRTPSPMSFDLPDAFYNELRHHSRKYYEDKIQTLATQVNLTKQVCDEGGSELADLAELVTKTEKLLEDFKRLVDAWEELPEVILKKEMELNDQQGKLAQKIDEKATQIPNVKLRSLDTAFKFLEAGLNLFKDLIGIAQNLEQLEKLIEGAKEKIKAIQQKKAEVYEDFIPLLEEAMHDIRAAGKSLGGQTLVGLSVKRWRVQGILQSMQNTIATFTSGLQVEPEFLDCVNTLNRALNLLIELYGHIERYEEKKELADYVANIHRVPNPIDQITEPELKKTVIDLEFLVHLNLFLHDYHVAMGAFKQWAFPFANKYFISGSEEELDLVKLLGMNKTAALEQTLSIYGNKVKRLSTQLLEYKSTTEHGDGILIAAKFLDGLVSMRPFVVWKNEQWRPHIRNLLSGKTIQLKADMDADPQMVRWYRVMTAIKFKCIRIRLRTTETSYQQNLDKMLDNFHMRMVHSGISEYRALGHNYVMYDSNQTLRYSFEEVGNEPVAWNVVKEKICQDGDYLMSPFTWWTLTLLPANPSVTQEMFDELVRKFGDQVNLDLEGDGLYLDEANAEPGQLDDLKLDQFYTSINDTSLSEFGNLPTGNCGQGLNSRIPDWTPNMTVTALLCPRGENWICFPDTNSRDKACNENQWVKLWKHALSTSGVCYCCQK